MANTNICWYLSLYRWPDISLQNTNISPDLGKTSHHYLIIPCYLSKQVWRFQFLYTKTLNDDLISHYKIQISHQISLQHLSSSCYTIISQGDIFIIFKVHVHVYVTSKWYVKKNPLLWIIYIDLKLWSLVHMMVHCIYNLIFME